MNDPPEMVYRSTEAFKMVGIDGRQKGKIHDTRIRIAGIKDHDNPHEIIAHSMHINYSGKGDDFTRAIEILMEEEVKKCF